MIRPSQVWRLVVIQQVLIRHGLDELVFSLHLFRPLQFVFYLLPWNWFRRERAPLAERILHALADLGPIFVAPITTCAALLLASIDATRSARSSKSTTSHP